MHSKLRGCKPTQGLVPALSQDDRTEEGTFQLQTGISILGIMFAPELNYIQFDLDG
jgi:hypothetical protein